MNNTFRNKLIAAGLVAAGTVASLAAPAQASPGWASALSSLSSSSTLPNIRIVPPGAVSSPSQVNVEAVRAQITDKTNQLRKTNRPDSRVVKAFPTARLQSGAQAWADEMARTGKRGHDPKFSQGGATSENVYIANYGLTAEQVLNSWMNSPGHRRNLLEGGNETGVGIARGADGIWYVVARYGHNIHGPQVLLNNPR